MTGGTGFLGRNMILRLSEEGYQVWAIVRPESRNIALLPQHKSIHLVFSELDSLETKVGSFPKTVRAFFHFAWSGVNREEIDSDTVQERNIAQSLSALRLAIGLGCGCFFFAGSRNEYGSIQGDYREDAICDPLDAYGKAKLAFGQKASELCCGTGTRFLHARIFSVYGPGDHPWSLIHTAVTKMLRGLPMELSDCTQLWNFMDIRDATDLMLTMVRQVERVPTNDNGIFNVATWDIRPLREYIEELRSLTKSNSVLRFGAYRQAAGSAVSLKPDTHKVETIFHWEPRISFADGIRYLILQMEEGHA